MSIIELVLAVIAGIVGLAGYQQWSKNRGKKEADFKQKKKKLENVLEELEKRNDDKENQEALLERKRERIKSEIDELNTEIVKENRNEDERLEDIDSMSPDDRNRRANEILYGSGDGR